MPSGTQAAPVSKKKLWAGRILSGVAVLFLLFDGVIKVMVIPPVVESMGRLGWPVRLAPVLGILEFVLIVLYLTPRTAILGAILLTGYLGGAVATHVRIGDPLFTHALFPIYVAVLLWGGLYLRDARVRTLITPRS